MSEPNKTLYEVLGVSSNAKATDITRAYNRILNDQKMETSAPNPRLVAQAKVAHETLSDPDKRDEYDALLRRRMLTGRSAKNKPFVIGAAAVAAIAILGIGYSMWHSHSLEEAARPKPMSPDQLLAFVGPNLWHVQGALMSGEVRDLGTAAAIQENKLVTTCQGLAAGMVITVKAGDATATAELASPNEALDVCVLTAKGVTAGLKLRGVPGSNDKLQAVFVNASGRLETRQVSGARPVAEAQGPALEVKAAAPLPNGTAIFDEYGNLAGLVVTPHPASEGSVFAIATGRFTQAKGTAAEPQVVEAPPPPRNIESTEPAPAQPVDDLGRPVTRPGMSAREKAKAQQDAAIEKVLKDAK